MGNIEMKDMYENFKCLEVYFIRVNFDLCKSNFQIHMLNFCHLERERERNVSAIYLIKLLSKDIRNAVILAIQSK